MEPRLYVQESMNRALPYLLMPDSE